MLPDVIYIQGQKFIRSVTETRVLYLVPHDKMRYDYDDRDRDHSLGWAFNPKINGKRRKSASSKSQPEVYRQRPENGFKMDTNWQNLLAAINPLHSRKKALSLLNPWLAFCNGEFGRFDQCRLMGGWVITGAVIGNQLKLKNLKINAPIPSAKDVLNDITLWGWCVSVRPDGYINYFQRLALDGTDKPVRMLNVSDADVYIPLEELYKLPRGFIPDPTWMPSPT